MADTARDTDRLLARQSRLVALVIAGTMLLWMGGQLLGPVLGLPDRYAFLFDFAALAALVWALVVTTQIWRARRAAQSGGK